MKRRQRRENERARGAGERRQERVYLYRARIRDQVQPLLLNLSAKPTNYYHLITREIITVLLSQLLMMQATTI